MKAIQKVIFSFIPGNITAAMMILLLYVIPLCAFLSCKKTESFSQDQYPQYWELQEMTHHMVGAVTTGDDMSFRETYVFYEEGHFMKIRLYQGVSTKAEGTFQVVITGGNRYFELTFESGIEIIGSCGPSGETLWMKAPDTMHSTWLQCDGPGLIYKRLKVTAEAF